MIFATLALPLLILLLSLVANSSAALPLSRRQEAGLAAAIQDIKNIATTTHGDGRSILQSVQQTPRESLSSFDDLLKGRTDTISSYIRTFPQGLGDFTSDLPLIRAGSALLLQAISQLLPQSDLVNRESVGGLFVDGAVCFYLSRLGQAIGAPAIDKGTFDRALLFSGSNRGFLEIAFPTTSTFIEDPTRGC